MGENIEPITIATIIMRNKAKCTKSRIYNNNKRASIHYMHHQCFIADSTACYCRVSIVC